MAEATKKLYRLPKQGQIAGVCAGLAEYFDIDVTLVRIIFIFLALITGGGFIVAYILMAIIMPSAEKGTNAGNDFTQNVHGLADELRDSNRQNKLRNIAGVGLILLGVWLFLGQLYPEWVSKGWDYVWPVLVILLGIFIATRRGK